MPITDMLIVWTIACGDNSVDVDERGTVSSDDVALARRLRACLEEPVDVSHTGAGGQRLILRPGDRRYVVARVRKLVADEADLEMVGLRLSGESATQGRVS
jgi:hypothetical protein